MTNIKKVEESRFGVYVWEMPDGALVADEDLNWLSIGAEKGDLKRIQAITNAARSYGITEGQPVFLAGRRQVTTEEYEEQIRRAKFGLTPDPYDIGALKDEIQYKKEHPDD